MKYDRKRYVFYGGEKRIKRGDKYVLRDTQIYKTGEGNVKSETNIFYGGEKHKKRRRQIYFTGHTNI